MNMSVLKTHYWIDFFCYAMRPQILKRSFIVALIVGTLLNLINQGDVLSGNAAFNLFKCLLTYTVPFCVATYGSVSALMALANNPEALGSCDTRLPAAPEA